MTQVTAESTEMELREMKKRLQEDGVDPAASDQDKMKHLWHIFLKTQSDLEELRGQQAEEMKEVENYVEHIRTLSEERESLTVELEAENEQLKGEAELMRVEMQGYKNDESREMLIQQGLEDIADSSSNEQIAYLLVERARLLDEIEAEQTRSSIQTPDGDLTAEALYKILQDEREDFEDELQTQRENMRAVKEQMRHLHEEEVSGLMEENEKIQHLLDDTKKKINVQEAEIALMRQGLDQLEANAMSRSQTSMDTVDGDSKAQLTILQNENIALKEKTEALTLELQAERGSGKQGVQEKDFSIEKLKDELERQRTQNEAANLKASSEKKNLEMIISTLERDLEDMHAREQDLKNKNKSLQSGSSSQLDDQQRAQLSELQSRNRSLTSDLEVARSSLQLEQQKVSDLETKIKRVERTMDENRRESEQQEDLLKTKIRTLEAKCVTLEGEVSERQTHMYTTQSQHRKELEDSLSQSEKQLREVKGQLREAKREKEDLVLDLEQQQSQNARLQRDMKKSTDRVLEIEKEALQSDRENRDLKHKLSQSTSQLEEREEQLKRERSRNSERAQDGDSRLTQALQDLQAVRQEVTQHRADSKHKEQKSLETESKLQRELADSQSNVSSLKRDLDKLQLTSEGEAATLTAKLQQTKQSNRTLEETVSEYEQESLKQQQELHKVKASERKLETQMESAETRQSDLEHRNSVLEQETQKAVQQVADVNERIHRLETANQSLQDELTRKSASYRELEDMLCQRQGDQEGVLKMAQSRADNAERRLYDLQSDLEEAMSRLQQAEHQTREASSLREELMLSRNENTKLQSQLLDEHEQQQTRSVRSEVTDDAASELSSMRERERDMQRRNNELQHMLVDVEARIESMKTQTQSASDLRQVAQQNQRNLSDHASLLQAEVETLKLELLTVSEKYHLQIMRYNERKLRTKDKLQRARELYKSEKAGLRAEVEKLQDEVVVLKGTLAKDQEWKQEMETSHHRLTLENRSILTQLAEEGESKRDHARAVSMLQVRCKYLEGENGTLLQRLDSVTRQKHNLDRMVKEYQSERSKESAYKAISPQTMAMLSPRLQGRIQARYNNSSAHSNQSLSDDDDGEQEENSDGSEEGSTMPSEGDTDPGDDIAYEDSNHGNMGEGGVARSSAKSDAAGYVYLSSGLPRQDLEDDARSTTTSIIDL